MTSFEQQKKKSAKPLLWIAMVSMSMVFAGLSSGYIVAKSDNWLFYDIPIWFYISTIFIVGSSFTMNKAKVLIKNDNQLDAVKWIKITLALGLSFAISQFLVWSSLVNQGFYFTGPDFNPTSGFLYVFTLLHLLHLAGGIIVLLVCWYKAVNLKYSNGNSLGFELASIFWHFLDILWVYLLLFFYFFG